MTNNEKYVVTGRYMRGTEVVGYHLVSSTGNEQKKVSREQFIFLLGKGLISNCTGQLYNDQVIIRGTAGVNIGALPIFDENKRNIRNASGLTNVVPKDGKMADIMNQLTITARLMNGRENIGFELRNYGGSVARYTREQVLSLAERRLITNATVQNLNEKGVNKKILRGAGIELRNLPRIELGGN